MPKHNELLTVPFDTKPGQDDPTPRDLLLRIVMDPYMLENNEKRGLIHGIIRWESTTIAGLRLDTLPTREVVTYERASTNETLRADLHPEHIEVRCGCNDDGPRFFAEATYKWRWSTHRRATA